MKKFKFLILGLAAMLPLLQSCNDSNMEGYSSVALVTIENPGGASDYSFTVDDGTTLYPTVKRGNASTYRPKNKQRAIISFTVLDDKISGYDHAIDLWICAEILTKDVQELTAENQDKFAENRIITNPEYRFISGGYLNVHYAVPISGSEKHTISLLKNTLVSDQENIESAGGKYDPDYTVLELRNTPEKPVVNGSDRSAYASFRLTDEYSPAVTGQKGIMLKYCTGFQDQQPIYEIIKIDYKNI